MKELVFMKNGKMAITSLELVDQINFFRKQEENKSQMTHDHLLKIIRDEFEDEISLGEIDEREYKNSRNQKQPMFELTTLQAKQLLARESKRVRKALLIYIERLENFIREKQTAEWQQARLQGKEIRREETDAIKALIDLAKSQGSTHYDTLYMTYSKLVKALVGYDKRDNATSDMLIEIMLFERTLDGIIAEEVESQTFYKEIYKKAKQELIRLKLYWSRPTISQSSQPLLSNTTISIIAQP